LTHGHQLPARFVIHTVGPVWHGGSRGERQLLASCYRRSLEIAGQQGFATLAFPCISTGVYGYPQELAARVAVTTVRANLDRFPGLQVITFCCFSAQDAATYHEVLAEDGQLRSGCE
jgi:O-acetyl-ADP-ribose deacetylase (regulator of RNase III)